MLYPKAALDAIVAYGYTDRQAEFLWLVATFGGHFLQSHYRRFARIGSGKGTSAFVSKALGLGHLRADEYTTSCSRYHLYSRPFYEAIGQGSNNHRRECSLTQVNRKLAQLDFVIDHQDYTFLPDEAARVAHFLSSGVPSSALPAKTYPAPTPGAAPRICHFVDKFPLAVSPRLLFSYVDEYALTLPSFATHLRQYMPLLRAVSRPFVFVFISPIPARFVDAEHIFGAALAAPPGVALEAGLERYFRIKHAIETEQWAQLKKRDYLDKEPLAERYETPQHAALYRSWLAATSPAPDAASGTPLEAHIEVYAPPSLPAPREYVEADR